MRAQSSVLRFKKYEVYFLNLDFGFEILKGGILPASIELDRQGVTAAAMLIGAAWLLG